MDEEFEEIEFLDEECLEEPIAQTSHQIEIAHSTMPENNLSDEDSLDVFEEEDLALQSSEDDECELDQLNKQRKTNKKNMSRIEIKKK